MSSDRQRLRGLTLFEVLAAVLVLGLIYTVLAAAAMRGLRSEGTDRRRAEAAMVADRELASLEDLIAAGEVLDVGAVEKEAPPYKIVVDVQPTDVLDMLPGPLRKEIAHKTDPKAPTLLFDERGQSRVQRVNVLVEWDEAGEPDHVERTTYAFDTSVLGELFPSSDEAGANSGDTSAESGGALDELRKMAPPELQSVDRRSDGQYGTPETEEKHGTLETEEKPRDDAMSAPGTCAASRWRPPIGRAGFTLFEVLGVVLVTTLLLTVLVTFYLNLSQQATRASDNTREVRRAGALLDRIASDFEATLLVKKPSDADALASPWIFLGESRFGLGGADQLKFIKREVPRSSAGPASDLAMVAYTLDHNPDGDRDTYVLRRWSTSELPESLDRELPRADDPASLVVTDELNYFAVRFLDEGGTWSDKWDSSQLVDSSELPMAVEIEVGLAPSRPEEDADRPLDEKPVHYARMVELPLRPLDLEALLKKEGENGEEGDENAENADKTLADCIDFSQVPSEFADLAAAAKKNGKAPFAPYASAVAGQPWVRAECR